MHSRANETKAEIFILLPGERVRFEARIKKLNTTIKNLIILRVGFPSYF